jgi:2-octaprenyl-6-methoxyphenol hydroxylase
MRPRFHAAVVGAGLVGSATALALARAGLNVALVEPREAVTPDETWDVRVYAISPGSEALLDGLGAWQRLDAARVQAVYRMDVHGDAAGALALDAYEGGVPKLASILESARLQHALWQAVGEHGNIEVFCPANVRDVAWGSPYSVIALDNGAELEAELVVGADGARSAIREKAGIQAKLSPYDQSGVVANFATEKPHRGTAFQWFRKYKPGCGDIIAYLPLPGNRMSLVWSTATEHAQALLALSGEDFCAQVKEAGESRLGRLNLITPPAAFPLRLAQLDSPVRAGCVLVGDAAHGVHPLAGQGVNLGFGDVSVLADVLAKRGMARCGDLALLERYSRRRAEPVARMQLVTDTLWRLFGRNERMAAVARNSGMSLLNKLNPVKSALIHEAFFN